MKNPKTIKAVVTALRWAADAMEHGEIECVLISHEDHMGDSGFGQMTDNGLRTFTIKYKYTVDETSALQELF